MESRRAWRLALLILLLISLGLRLPLLGQRVFDPDEFQHLHSVYSISSGLLPYRDYFEHHPPLFHYLLSWLYPVWGPSLTTLFATRGVMLLLTILALYLTYCLGKVAFDADVGLLGTVLVAFAVPFVMKTLEVRPDVPQLVCWLTGLIILAHGFHHPSRGRFFLSGLAFGLAVMFSQKALFGVAGVIAALAWWFCRYYRSCGGRNSCSLGLLFFLGLAIPFGVTALFFLAHGALREFLHCTLLVNLNWPTYNPWNTLKDAAGSSPFLIALGLAGFLSLATNPLWLRNVKPEEMLLLCCACAIGAGIFVIPVPYRQYLMPLWPLWALFAAYALWRAPEDMTVAKFSESRPSRKKHFFRLSICSVYLILAVLVVGRLCHRPPKLMGSSWLYAGLWGFLGIAAVVVWRCHGWRRLPLSAALLAVASWVIFPAAWLGPVVLAASPFLVLLIWLANRESLLLLVLAGILIVPITQLQPEANPGNQAQLQEIRYILTNTSEDDAVLDGWSGLGVFRPHAYFYFFLHEGVRARLAPQQLGSDIVQTLHARKPKIVIYDEQMRELPREVQQIITAHYRAARVGMIYLRRDNGP